MTKSEQYQSIKQWLQSGDYKTGVALLEVIKPKHQNLALFKSVDNSKPGDMHFDILRNKLELEMYDLGSHLSVDAKTEETVKPLIQTLEPVTTASGAKILKASEINETDLPYELKIVFARTKELTPLIARIHTELADEGLDAEKAANLTTELLALDDERARCWEKLDAWAENRDEILIEDDSTDETDPVKKGVEIAKRIERLKENISRTQKAIETNDRPNIKARNEAKLKAYQDELAELQKIV
jgi:hypothetical protein